MQKWPFLQPAAQRKVDPVIEFVVRSDAEYDEDDQYHGDTISSMSISHVLSVSHGNKYFARAYC